MEYVTIVKQYKLSPLIKKGSGPEGGNNYEAEAKGWDNALNEKAKKGFKVINSGIIVSDKDVIFWAMLEKP